MQTRITNNICYNNLPSSRLSKEFFEHLICDLLKDDEDYKRTVAITIGGSYIRGEETIYSDIDIDCWLVNKTPKDEAYLLKFYNLNPTKDDKSKEKLDDVLVSISKEDYSELCNNIINSAEQELDITEINYMIPGLLSQVIIFDNFKYFNCKKLSTAVDGDDTQSTLCKQNIYHLQDLKAAISNLNYSNVNNGSINWLSAKINKHIGNELMGYCEEVHKLLSSIIRNDFATIVYSMNSLLFALPKLISLFFKLKLESENLHFTKVIDFMHNSDDIQHNQWSLSMKIAIGLEPITTINNKTQRIITLEKELENQHHLVDILLKSIEVLKVFSLSYNIMKPILTEANDVVVKTTISIIKRDGFIT